VHIHFRIYRKRHSSALRSASPTGDSGSRFVRNPMYIGAGLGLASAALFYESLPLLGYAGLFFLATHLFVVWYEEPTLRRTFGQKYEAYCRQVGRWWPSV
ncbi:MAG: hypothetical protein LC770_04010, partial [Acidobacteria bacterium]|nr:hypothetical protein [Acidobacteriota bacterium]